MPVEATSADATADTWDVRPKIGALFGLGNLIFGNFIRPQQQQQNTTTDVTLGNTT